MNQFKKKKFVILLLLWMGCLLFPASGMTAETYTFGMLPRYFPDTIKAMTQPLAEYLAKKTGNRIVMVVADDFSDYEKKVASGAIQIGYENPLVYTKVSESHEVLCMSLKGEGKHQFRGIVITPADSEIQSVSDLKHKKIMITGHDSAGGFLSQKLTLMQNGISVEEDCDIEEASGNKQENVIIAVSIGDVDAGFIRESAFHAADQFIRPGSIKSLTPAAWLPNWALSVNRTLPEPVKAKIQSALLELPENDPVLKALAVSGFRLATDPDYDTIRKLN